MRPLTPSRYGSLAASTFSRLGTARALPRIAMKNTPWITKITPFAVGRRWRLKRETSDYVRGWWVIVGPGENYAGKPSKTHKLCRFEVHPEDVGSGKRGDPMLHGSTADHEPQSYSHTHIKKYAVLEPI
jgi:hypothetical protein